LEVPTDIKDQLVEILNMFSSLAAAVGVMVVEEQAEYLETVH
jgi:hypothetical protein